MSYVRNGTVTRKRAGQAFNRQDSHILDFFLSQLPYLGMRFFFVSECANVERKNNNRLKIVIFEKFSFPSGHMTLNELK